MPIPATEPNAIPAQQVIVIKRTLRFIFLAFLLIEAFYRNGNASRLCSVRPVENFQCKIDLLCNGQGIIG